jgi:uncharacterized protein (TIGR00730 family)
LPQEDEDTSSQEPTDGPPPQWGKAPLRTDDEALLHGPQSRGSEFARMFRIMFDVFRGLRSLHFVGPCVTIFGSARFDENHRYYKLARAAAAEIGRAGFTIMTGGGPGIMEAANRGARDVKATSVGCNILLPKEQAPNPYLDRFVEFRYFFVRKMMLVKYSYAFVALPGGFGTMDEIFETATLVQTGKIRNFPIILMGRDYWQPLLDFLRDTMLRERAIDAQDLERLIVTDSPTEAAARIMEAGTQQFGLRFKKPRRRWILGER